MTGAQAASAAGWSQHDSALWHTVDILAAWLTGSIQQRPQVLTPFALAGGENEQVLVEGGYELYEYVALGDGSYAHSTTLVGGSGFLGLALAAGTLAGSAMGNARRRAEAQRNAAERWHPTDRGQLFVSTHGFYLSNQYGLRPWTWAGIDAATVVGPTGVHVQGRGWGGTPISWIVRADWAELLFVMWALARHRQHPQLLTGGWLPPGWTERAQRHGYMPVRQMTDITRALAGR